MQQLTDSRVLFKYSFESITSEVILTSSIPFRKQLKFFLFWRYSVTSSPKASRSGIWHDEVFTMRRDCVGVLELFSFSAANALCKSENEAILLNVVVCSFWIRCLGKFFKIIKVNYDNSTLRSIICLPVLLFKRLNLLLFLTWTGDKKLMMYTLV